MYPQPISLSPPRSLLSPVPLPPGSSCVAVKFVPSRSSATHGAPRSRGVVVLSANETAVGWGGVDVHAEIVSNMSSGTPTPPRQRPLLVPEAVDVGAEADGEEISATTTASRKAVDVAA